MVYRGSDKIEYRVGDLFEYEGLVIAHGCNTKGVMGAGIAKIVADRWPSQVYKPYMEAVAYREFVPGAAQVCAADRKRLVANLATQDHPGPCARTWWVMLAFGNLFEQLRDRKITEVAIPRIGCGIGGMKWSDVEMMIRFVQENVPGIDVVVYTHPSETDKVW